MPRVLVIDGDGSRRVALAAALAAAGHDIELAASAAAGLPLARTSTPDIVLVEAAIPDGSGPAVCARLREEQTTSATLVVVVGASNAEPDRVAAFEAGADDYVVRPFSTRELLLRIRALMRRASRRRIPSDIVALGPIQIDRHARRVSVDGGRVELTRREFDLLLRLVDGRGRVLTRTALVSELWPEDAGSLRVVDTTLKRLRRKLPWLVARLRTVRGVGYEIHEE